MTNTNRERGEECVFCAFTFPETEVLNIEPLNPVVPGHRIFIPKEHVSDFADDPQATIKTMYSAHQYAKEKGGEWNLITSKGKNATQSVFHLHVHLVPRQENDNLLLPWTGAQALKDAREEAYQAGLRRAMEIFNGKH